MRLGTLSFICYYVFNKEGAAYEIRIRKMQHQRNRQDIQRQLRELKAAGADAVIWEYEHGDAVHKAELDALLQERAKAGDTIIATEISRLSRSTKQLCEIIDRVKEKRLRLVILAALP